MDINSKNILLSILTDTKKSKKLVCPYCKIELKRVYYTGYYEEFCMWGCDCSQFEKYDEYIDGDYT
jgi:hypothetical protein